MLLIAADDGYWVWVERASWIMVSISLVVGLFAVAYQVRQLRFDQRRWTEAQERLAAQLAKAPRIVVGFVADDTVRPIWDHFTKITALTATWPVDQDLSNPVEVRIYVCNAGERSAKDAAFELCFGGGVHRAGSNDSEDGVTSVMSDGRVVHFEAEIRLNPYQFQPLITKLKVPKSTPEIPVTVKASMDDYPNIREDLIVRVEYRGTTSAASRLTAPKF